MKIELIEITVGQVADGFVENYADNSVVGYGGRLNIRPKYQREFVYADDKRNAVVDTIRKGFPLNVMYWVENEDGSFEVLDGQQRTISFCQYINGDFSLNDQYFHNLEGDEKEQILNYKLFIYVCKGTDREKLDWFRIINIAGEKLTEQELRNAVYSGTWLTDAKRYFSRNGCPAYGMAGKLLNGSSIRQDYLETAIKWISKNNIENYMAVHQHDQNANELWLYFQNVVNWVNATFPNYRKEMKGVEWGFLYNQYKDVSVNTDELEARVCALMQDDDVTKKSGIYEYVFDGEERHLSIRAFQPGMKRAAYERQRGICPKCGDHFEIEDMQADHITPWHLGGKTVVENCQMLCADCNRRKSGK